MLTDVHQHVVSELQQCSKTDTVFVITAVLFNLVVLGINWGVAEASHSEKATGANDLILVVLVVATLLINVCAYRALKAGRQTRATLITGLLTMYRDQGVDKYYDPGLLDTYGARYKLFMAVLAVLAAIAVVVPLLARFSG